MCRNSNGRTVCLFLVSSEGLGRKDDLGQGSEPREDEPPGLAACPVGEARPQDLF